MFKIKFQAASFILGIAAFVFFLAVLIGFSGVWLFSGFDQPEKSDLIVVLAGEHTRAFYAADLYLQGFAPKVYISKPIRNQSQVLLDKLGIFSLKAEEIDREILLRKSVPEKDIGIFGESSLSTVEEAEAIAEIFSGKKIKLLLVTSPYHVKRAKMIFQDKNKDADIKVVATPYEKSVTKWWASQDSAKAVLFEVSKIAFYKLGGNFRSNDKE